MRGPVFMKTFISCKVTEPEIFPATCRDGVLDLDGIFTVRNHQIIQSVQDKCILRGVGPRGATVLLNAPLTFTGLSI